MTYSLEFIIFSFSHKFITIIFKKLIVFEVPDFKRVFRNILTRILITSGLKIDGLMVECPSFDRSIYLKISGSHSKDFEK